MIEINSYKFKLINIGSSSYLKLILIPNGEKEEYYHYIKYIDDFFNSLGISREEFCEKFNITNGCVVFPEFKSIQKDEVLNYL